MVMEEQKSDMELASENIPVPQVQEPKIDTIKRNNKSSVSRGKPRLRKKALHALIVKQMEFYFSDANLSKDRFLTLLLKKDSYIGLDIFMRCNKLRELSVDTNRIAKALQGSTMLKVSEDGTKVCRITPINRKENTDECTIYVQNLPPDTDHDWLISIFSKYGPVEYVSIPRYKSNSKIKGFAFVEFDTPRSAQECIKRFQKKGCVLPSHISPDDLLSITTFGHKNDYTVQAIKPNTKLKFEDNEKEKASEDETEDNDNVHDNKMATMDNDRQNLKKRKLAPAKTFVDENEIKTKRRKKSVDQSIIDQRNDQTSKDKTEDKDTHNNEIDTVDNNSRQNLRKRKFSLEESRVIDKNDVNITENSNIENQENKNVNRNKSIEKKKRRVTISNTVTIEDISGETVKIVKKESHGSATISNKNIGTECLDKDNNGETSIISQTKKHPTTRDGMASSDNEEASIDEKKKKRYRKKKSKIEEDDICNMIGLQVMTKINWKHLRNRYLNLQKSKMRQLKQHLKKAEIERGGIIRKWNYDKSKYERDNRKNNETEKSVYGRINYASGIIVKIEMDEPCTDLHSFKMELKDNNSSVRYIDVTPGSCEAFVRFDTAETAQLLAQKSHEGRRFTVLEDDEEREYWDKIALDREEKLNKKKKFKQRGRYKLLKRAEKELGKCIKFDQD